MVLQFVFILLLQDQHLPLTIYLNEIIVWYIFSDGLIYANILEHFNFVLDQFRCANTFDLI